jgi:putative aminopeptidase FrvX
MTRTPRRTPRRLAIGALTLIFAVGAARAAGFDLKDLIREAFSIPSVTGSEDLLAGKILSYLPRAGAETDNLGSVHVRFGQGGSRLAFCAPLDEYGWFVSGITPDGYIRLDRTGQPHPNYDGYLLGHPVVISTQRGLQSGVVVQPSMHLITRERREELRNFALDMAYVDIGAHSEDEARRKGVERLDAVALWPDLSVLAGDKWAGPSLGQKSACALLLALADDLGKAKLSQEVALSWLAQTKFPARSAGQGAPRAAQGAARARKTLQARFAVAVDAVPADRDERSPAFGKGPALILPRDGAPRLREAVEAAAREAKVAIQVLTGAADSMLLNGLAGEGTEAVLLALPVKFGQTPVEVVDLKDVQGLRAVLLQLAQSGRAK